jgi:hypothetical protein
MPKLSFLLWANDRAEGIDSFFVHCVAVNSQGRRRLQNLLNFQPFGSSVSRLDHAGG